MSQGLSQGLHETERVLEEREEETVMYTQGLAGRKNVERERCQKA